MYMRPKFLKVCLLVFSLLMVASTSFAYLSDIKIIPTKDIEKLTDDGLGGVYFDVLIELTAITANHQGSGFSPNEYKQFKELLRYQYNLKRELQKRQLEIPKIEF